MIEAVEVYGAPATHVKVAVYLNQITSVNIKNSQFQAELTVGYAWEGADYNFADKGTMGFYKGVINQVSDEQRIDEGNKHYQRVRYLVTINKTFWTPRFPLESHQLRIYLEPAGNVGQIVLEPVTDECGYNGSSTITGYHLERFAVAQNIIFDDNVLLNPVYESYEDHNIYKTEIMTQVEINRDGFGLYIKCCVALYGTMAWVLMCLYIAAFRRVDPLSMIGAAFFGAVSNVMVGSNLLPDALQLGLVEYINFFGVAIIIGGAAVVIAINTIRKEKGNEAFASFYGRLMLALFAIIAVVGNIALPLSAYL